MDCAVYSGFGDRYVKFCLSLMHAEVEEGKTFITEEEQSKLKKRKRETENENPVD